MAAKPSRVTLADVAQQAGVHVTTASAVLNKTRSGTRVSEETRQRVQAVAAALGYVPNAAARGLRRGRFENLGVFLPLVLPDLIVESYYATGILRGVLGEAHRAGYHVTLPCRSRFGPEPAAAAFRNQGIDGYLVVAPFPGYDPVAAIQAAAMPLVVVAPSEEMLEMPSVGLDNEQGTRLALKHLLGQGHHRIAFLQDNMGQPDSLARRDAFTAHLCTASEPALPECIGIADYDQESVTRVLAEWLRRPLRPTAIVAANDLLAFWAVRAAQSLGFSVPEDLSVVGFDDSPEAVRCEPSLTSVRQPLVKMGCLATRMLISLLRGDAVSPRQHRFPAELVVRGSTAPPSAPI